MMFLLIWRYVIISLPWREEMGGVRVRGLMGGICWRGESGEIGDGKQNKVEQVTTTKCGVLTKLSFHLKPKYSIVCVKTEANCQ